jgi:hypothetical protein
MSTAKHTRRSGKQLTYDIDITLNSYEISLDGTVLKYSGVFAGQFGNVTGAEALLVHAVSDIENLTGMVEE